MSRIKKGVELLFVTGEINLSDSLVRIARTIGWFPTAGDEVGTGYHLHPDAPRRAHRVVSGGTPLSLTEEASQASEEARLISIMAHQRRNVG